MIILDSTDLTHSISVYIRQEVTTATAVVLEEETQIETTSIITGTYASGVLTFTLTHTFLDKRFYFLELSSEGVNINKSKIFATTETDLEAFSMNTDYYTTITKDAKTFKVKQ